MGEKRDYWKLITGETFEETTRIPTFEQVLDEQWKGLKTKYPLRLLGTSNNGDLTITEEERPHAHLIGSTGEGKSKFIEHLVREDIRRGFGVCLLDPTTGAKTAYDILKWCCSQRFEKVCLIDPHHRWKYNKVAGINPFLYRKDGDAIVKSEKLKKTSSDSIVETLRILFQTKDPAQTSFINRYLPAVLNCLYNAQRPLSDALYFTNQVYISQREEILNCSLPTDPFRLDLEEGFRNAHVFVNQMQTTVNRLKPFFQDPLGLMFGVDRGIDFMQMVRDKWVILVNLDTSLDLDIMDARLLGTMVINQVFLAKERLYDKGYAKRYYLYIDEAGEYATRKIARALTLKGKTGLRVTIGHQYFGQFEDKYVVEAINALTKLKAMFNLPGREDRDQITRMFYGGDVSDRQASFANADLPRQHAVIKTGKVSPQRVRIPDVAKPAITKEQFESYINKLYKQPWYFEPHKIQEAHKKKSTYAQPSIQPRPTKNPRPSRSGAKANNPTVDGTVKGKSAFSKAKQTGDK